MDNENFKYNTCTFVEQSFVAFRNHYLRKHMEPLNLIAQNVFITRYTPNEHLLMLRFLTYLCLEKKYVGVICLDVGILFLDLERLNVFIIHYNLVFILVFHI